MEPTSTHIVIPDTQVHSGTPTAPLEWIGAYIAEQFGGRRNVKIVHLGDHADMPSLSIYDKPGSKSMEGRRYREDIDAANEAFDLLNEPLRLWAQEHKKKWPAEKHVLLGNHENRINRAIESDPVKFEGVISTKDLNFADLGWTVHDFLEPVWLDGVCYAHYAVNPMTGRPLGGSAQLQLQRLGHTMITGHQQTLDYAVRYMRNHRGEMRSVHRIVAGAAYGHHEDYLGPQGNAHWRGILVLHDVREGSFDPMFVSLSYLCRRYAGKSFRDWQKSVGIQPQ